MSNNTSAPGWLELIGLLAVVVVLMAQFVTDVETWSNSNTLQSLEKRVEKIEGMKK